MKNMLLVAMLVALGGCAASYTESSLPADHPASSAAEEAPAPTRWHTLDLMAADPLGPAEPAMVHAGHGAGEHKHETLPVPAAREAAGTAAPAVYSCPMHPEVTSDRPDQRCPKCGMKLRRQDGGKQP